MAPGEEPGRPFLVMELLEGRALGELIEGKPMPLERIVELGSQLAGALGGRPRRRHRASGHQAVEPVRHRRGQRKDPGGAQRPGPARGPEGRRAHAEALATLDEYIEAYREGAAFQIAEVYAYRGETDAAFEWLERAYVQRDGGLAAMKVDPYLRSLWDDARWLAFLERMNLAD